MSSPTWAIPAPLRRWLEATYPTCGRHGCDSTFHLEIDHIISLAEDAEPPYKRNLWRLCHHDHFLKHHRGWNVTYDHHGHPDLVPPDHPDPPPK